MLPDYYKNWVQCDYRMFKLSFEIMKKTYSFDPNDELTELT